MVLTKNVLRNIKKNPNKYNKKQLINYLKEKNVTGISSLLKDQIINIVGEVKRKITQKQKKDQKNKINKSINYFKKINDDRKVFVKKIMLRDNTLDDEIKIFDKVVNEIEKMIFTKKESKKIKEDKKELEKDIKEFNNIVNKFKDAEIKKYKKKIDNIELNNFNWSIENWTMIESPKYCEWIDIARLLASRVNENNLMFIGTNNNDDDQDITEVIWTVTSNNKRRFIKRMKDITKESILKVEGEKSDAEVFEMITERNYIYVLLARKNTTKTKKLLKGEMFKYFHNINMDFSRYQIYTKEQIEEINTEPCLIHCMRMGEINDEKIRIAKRYIKIDMLPLKVVKKVAEKIDVEITINDCKNSNKYIYNKGANDKLNINLYDEHYFINDKETNITLYSLNNYDKVKNIDRFNEIYQKTGKGNYNYSKDKNVTSFKLIKFLLDNKDKYLKRILEELKFKRKEKEEEEIELEYDEEECQLNEYKEKKDLTDKELIFFDFETTTDGKEHEAYLISASRYKKEDNSMKYNKINGKTFYGKNCALEFLRWINTDAIILAHNLKYDFQFLMRHLMRESLIERNNKIMGGEVTFYNKIMKKAYKLILRDTKLMINNKLADFPEMFFNKEDQKIIKKEIMPYSLYNKENIEKENMSIKKAIKEIKKKDREEFKKNLKEWKLIEEEDYYDHMEYARIYCEQDVNVMSKGYFQFREWIYEITGLDIVNFLTISSIADEYLVKEGCYEGCNKLSSNVRKFIQKCVVGGRCMIRNNKKRKCNKRVQDFDAVSMYSSAMVILGFLRGLPKILNTKDYSVIKNYDGYFIKINITKVNKKLNFPLINRKNKEGIREFKNNLLGEHYVDKTTLEDYIKYQKIEFEIIEGYYFNEGRNYKINECIQKLFDERAKKKKEKNPIQNIYKLLMNSCYGKTILKEQEYKIIYKDNEDEAIKYIIRNSDNIVAFNKIAHCNKYKIKVLLTTDDLYTSPHIGAEILSMSKRIMNEVMCLAEEIGCIIYYQDTDSMHILEKDIDKLAKEYKKRYGRDLIGEKLGQFHCDFEVGQDKGTIPVSIESIYCAKKIYMDKISCIIKGEESIKYHLRCKGAPKESIDEACKEYKGDYVKLYDDLLEGKPIEFNLLTSGVKFKFNKDYTITNITNFTREIKIK